MGHAVNSASGLPLKPFTPEDDANLRESLKRCSAATYEAAAQFRKTGNTEHLPAIVLGIIERYVEPDLRAKLKDADDDLRIIEDLGIDSLTMMEIVILVEDVLQMSINNEELRHLRAVGDVKTFIECKVRGLPLPKPTKFLPIEQIVSVMPIQPPFLFLSEASVNAHGANAKYKISGQEFFLQGHFKDNPVLPASIMLEALGQLAVLFLLEGQVGEPGKVVDPRTIFFTSCEGVRCHRVCRPGAVGDVRGADPRRPGEGRARRGDHPHVCVGRRGGQAGAGRRDPGPRRGLRGQRAGRGQRLTARPRRG
jgi:acyl carrier protein